MTEKDWLTVGLSLAAFIVAGASFFFSHVHRPSRAMLILLERTFSPGIMSASLSGGESFTVQDEIQTPIIRHLKYSLSNTGKQALYVKDVEVLVGPDTLGNFRSKGSFAIVPSNEIQGFLLEPGDIKVIEIDHSVDFFFGDHFDYQKNCHQLVSLIIVSADGSRYQICHDITSLGASGPDFNHPIWDAQKLGDPLRRKGFF